MADFIISYNKVFSKNTVMYNLKNNDFKKKYIKAIQCNNVLFMSDDSFINQTDEYIIIVHGKIYNEEEITKKLSLNYSSKFEYIVKGFELYDYNFFGMLNGEFAITFFNKKNNILTFVNDHAGVIPIYYYEDKSQIIFSTEIKAILEYKNYNIEINDGAVLSYLSFRYSVGENTFFKGIRKLTPNIFMQIDGTDIKKIKYYQNKMFDFSNKYNGDYYEIIDCLLRESVENRCCKNNNFGLLLSGGVDSSLISYYAQHFSPRCFMLEYPETNYSEAQYAQVVATKFNLKIDVLSMSEKEYFKLLPKVISQKCQPLSVPHEVSFFKIFRYISSCGISDTLCGEGADELFGGYGRIMHSYLDYEKLEFIQRHNSLRKPLKWILFDREFRSSWFDDLIESADVFEFFLHQYRWFPIDVQRSILKNSLIFHVGKYDKNLLIDVKEDSKFLSNENKFLFYFQQIHLPNLLDRLHSTSNCFGVNNHLPFLDKNIIDFANNIPYKYKIRFNSKYSKLRSIFCSSNKYSEIYDTPKFLLKKLAENKIPREVLYRKKMGFPVPLNKWIGNNILNVKDVILDRKSICLRYFDENKLNEFISNFNTDNKYDIYGKQIWMLYNLEIWNEMISKKGNI